MTEQHPTVVLVHGAFADSSSWNDVVDVLRRSGTPVVAVANPLRSLDGDATYLRDVVRAIDGPVVLVGHSYGGMVITEAAAELDSVVGLVYVDAFAPLPGESALTLSTRLPGSTLGDALVAYPVTSGGNELIIDRDRFPAQFAADLPLEQAVVMAITQRPVTEAALAAPSTARAAAWETIPSWFVFSDQDRNIPVALHRFLADRARARGVHEVAGASHALAVAAPGAVAACITEAVEALTPAAR